MEAVAVECPNEFGVIMGVELSVTDGTSRAAGLRVAWAPGMYEGEADLVAGPMPDGSNLAADGKAYGPGWRDGAGLIANTVFFRAVGNELKFIFRNTDWEHPGTFSAKVMYLPVTF